MPAAPQSRRRLVRIAVVVAAAASVLAAAAGATGPTTITFAEHPVGTVIDTEYASHGVRFGKAGELGAPALAGAWDCGAPQVKQLTSDGTPPKLGQAPICGGRSGTVAAFAHPRKTIRLVVEATPSTDRQADVLAYGASGTLLTSTRVSGHHPSRGNRLAGLPRNGCRRGRLPGDVERDQGRLARRTSRRADGGRVSRRPPPLALRL